VRPARPPRIAEHSAIRHVRRDANAAFILVAERLTEISSGKNAWAEHRWLGSARSLARWVLQVLDRVVAEEGATDRHPAAGLTVRGADGIAVWLQTGGECVRQRLRRPMIISEKYATDDCAYSNVWSWHRRHPVLARKSVS